MWVSWAIIGGLSQQLVGRLLDGVHHTLNKLCVPSVPSESPGYFPRLFASHSLGAPDLMHWAGFLYQLVPHLGIQPTSDQHSFCCLWNCGRRTLRYGGPSVLRHFLYSGVHSGSWNPSLEGGAEREMILFSGISRAGEARCHSPALFPPKGEIGGQGRSLGPEIRHIEEGVMQVKPNCSSYCY